MHCLQSWPPGCVTWVTTSPWITLLALSVSIDSLSSSARVTSVKSYKRLGVTDGWTSGPIDRTPSLPGSDKKIIALVIPTKNIFCKKNSSKTVICGLSSGQTNLHPPIWGHGRQLDERHRNPNINIREIIWLGNQLKKSKVLIATEIEALVATLFLEE